MRKQKQEARVEYVVTPKKGEPFVSSRKLDAIYEHVKYKRGEATFVVREVK